MNCDNWNYLKTSKLHECEIISVWGCFFSDRDFKTTDEGLYSALMAIGIQIIRWYKRMCRKEIFRANKEATWLYKHKKKQNINLMWLLSLVVSLGMTRNCLNYCSFLFCCNAWLKNKGVGNVSLLHFPTSRILPYPARQASIDSCHIFVVSVNELGLKHAKI